MIPEPLAMAVSIFLLHRFLAQKHSSDDMAGPNFKVVWQPRVALGARTHVRIEFSTPKPNPEKKIIFIFLHAF